MSNDAHAEQGGGTPPYVEEENTDPSWWVHKPTPDFHGLRVLDHDGTVFIEQVTYEGEEVQSIMVGGRDFERVEKMAEAFNEVVARHE